MLQTIASKFQDFDASSSSYKDQSILVIRIPSHQTKQSREECGAFGSTFCFYHGTSSDTVLCNFACCGCFISSLSLPSTPPHTRIHSQTCKTSHSTRYHLYIALHACISFYLFCVSYKSKEEGI